MRQNKRDKLQDLRVDILLVESLLSKLRSPEIRTEVNDMLKVVRDYLVREEKRVAYERKSIR